MEEKLKQYGVGYMRKPADNWVDCSNLRQHNRKLDRLKQVLEATKEGGATLTGMLGTSAWYAPGAAVSALVHSISCDQNKMFPCSVMLDGEYGLTDLCIGVPVILGRNGVKKIVELDLNDLETQKLNESAEGVKKTNGLLV